MNKLFDIIRFINGRRCPVCGRSIDISDKPVLCKECSSIWTEECNEVICDINNGTINKKLPDAIHYMIFLTYYRSYSSTPSKKMILKLKENNTRDIYDFFADRLADEIVRRYNGRPCDTVITNVPRSRKAVIKYGFDQAKLLAQSISKKLGINYTDPLGYKAGRRFIQQKKLTWDERKLNASGAYFIKIKKIASFHGKRCILIDDIYTTGATLAACAKLLDGYGAKYIDCAVIAKTI
jgi:ComF family protein